MSCLGLFKYSFAPEAERSPEVTNAGGQEPDHAVDRLIHRHPAPPDQQRLAPVVLQGRQVINGGLRPVLSQIGGFDRRK